MGGRRALWCRLGAAIVVYAAVGIFFRVAALVGIIFFLGKEPIIIFFFFFSNPLSSTLRIRLFYRADDDGGGRRWGGGAGPLFRRRWGGSAPSPRTYFWAVYLDVGSPGEEGGKKVGGRKDSIIEIRPPFSPYSILAGAEVIMAGEWVCRTRRAGRGVPRYYIVWRGVGWVGCGISWPAGNNSALLRRG